MPFTVTCRNKVRDDLAEIWLASDDKQAVADASDRLDRQLKRDPFAGAVQMAGGLWAILIPPLRALYMLRPADRVVEIVKIDAIP